MHSREREEVHQQHGTFVLIELRRETSGFIIYSGQQRSLCFHLSLGNSAPGCAVKLVLRLSLIAVVGFTFFLSACGGAGQSSETQSPQPPEASKPPKTITEVNHVIIMLQENRSFDDYFGQMTAYRQENHIPINSSDGKINDLSTGSYSNRNFSTGQDIASYHSGSVCTEDLTPDWGPSHIMMNHSQPAAAGPGSPMDGFVSMAYNISQFGISLGIPIADTTGRRAMGYFDDDQLNYYYFMAANFAMSDAFYSPAPTRTAVNRLYVHGATSQGYAHEPTGAQLTAKTIWQALDEKGVSWKIYYTDTRKGFTSYAQFFTYFNDPKVQAHIVPVSEYLSDVQNGTLPAVSFIETGMFTERDEHPSNFDPRNPQNGLGPVNVQVGAKYVASLIDALMQSPSWKDSVFFFSFDEGGGLFDHVPPISVPSPDGIKPKDLFANDVPGDFTITGFRLPNFVVSPFARKNFVSHTPMDFTAYLAFIEKR